MCAERCHFVLYASCILCSNGFCLVICLNDISLVGLLSSKNRKVLSLEERKIMGFVTILTD